MKRIITSAGLMAVGVAGLQAANDYGLSPVEASKFWNVSAALRGFYDDNPVTLPDASPGKTETWGFEVVPNVTFNFPMERTFIAFGYQYTFRYYTESVFSKHDDQAHQFRLKLDHKFTDRFRLRFDDSFVYSTEPEIVDQNISTAIRSQADGIRNYAPLTFNAQLTERIGLEAGYQNNYYNYFDEGSGSRNALLDRMEHLAHLDGRYTFQETMVGLVGYQFGYVDYDGNESLYVANPGSAYNSDLRDNLNHYFYAGAEVSTLKNLVIGAKGGARYTDYEKTGETTWAPYFDVTGTYTYLPGSFVRLGFKNDRAATDVVGLFTGNPDLDSDPTLDQEYSLVYVQLSHRITPSLTGTVIGSYQNSRFHAGVANEESEDLLSVGVNLNYRINQHFSAEAGYSYDNLNSDVSYVSRDYSRNRVYLGVRATY